MNLLRRLFFNLRYYLDPPWDTGVSPPELMKVIKNQPAGRALDLGCGTGTNVITLARHGWQVSGVDFAPRAIYLARRKAKEAGVEADLHVDNVTRLTGISGPFDLILDIGCYHSIPKEDRPAYQANLDRLLAPGGIFLLYAFVSRAADSPLGLDEQDLHSIQKRLHLVYRQDGSERGRRPSAWFQFEKP